MSRRSTWPPGSTAPRRERVPTATVERRAPRTLQEPVVPVTPERYVRRMLCIACGSPARTLCAACRRTLEPASPRSIHGVLAVAPFRHHGAAASLVRNLKYRRSRRAGRFLAGAMVAILPRDASCLVPVPRAPVRRVAHGVDPAHELSVLIGGTTGLPVIAALDPPLWWRSHAGRGAADRAPVTFRLTRDVPDGAVVVDDVLTTGATVAAAIGVLGADKITVASATAAGTMSTGANSPPTQGGGVARKRQSVLGPLFAARTSSAPVPRATHGIVPARGLLHPREEDG